MKQTFYQCAHCGNLVAMIQDKGVPVYCCSEKMQQLQPGVTEGSGEKHVPVYTVEGSTVTVRIGAAEHPMTQEHSISWICLETEKGAQYRVLSPGDKPEACFHLTQDDSVQAVYAFCNQHSLWKK